MAEFGASLGVVERVEILPFHQLGQYKWERLGLTYELEATKPPTVEEVANAVAIFRAAGLQARLARPAGAGQSRLRSLTLNSSSMCASTRETPSPSPNSLASSVPEAAATS